MGIKKVITRSTLCRLKTTVRRTPTPSSRRGASSHRILSSLTHSGGFAASLDKIYGHVGMVCVESTSKNGFSDGWYALNPSHGQEGGETADSAFTSRVQGASCFPGDEGRVGHILPSARCRLHDRQQGRQWQVRLADNSNRARSRVVCSRASRNRGDIGPAQRAMARKHCVENSQLAQSIYELRILGG
jgi:hypothetical protein